MPGVPKSTGCEACRRQKKRCLVTHDGATTCIRCDRLRLDCRGRGQRRFKFQDVSGQFVEQREEGIVAAGPSAALSAAVSARPSTSPGAPPSNGLDRLTSILVYSIDPTAPIRLQLPWNFGGFLAEIPARLGSNGALDAAADVLVTAYGRFVAGRHVAAPEVWAKQNVAVRALRRCLEDPVVAYSSETLCCCMVLMVVQSLPGLYGNVPGTHAMGAAQILKGRGHTGPKDEFESILLLSLRGPVVVQALIDPRVTMTPEQWRDLITNSHDTNTVDGRMMHTLSLLPPIMDRGRDLLACLDRMPSGSRGSDIITPFNSFVISTTSTTTTASPSASSPSTSPLASILSDISTLSVEVHRLRDAFTPVLAELRARWKDLEGSVARLYPDLRGLDHGRTILHAHFSRSYGMGLAVAVLIDTVLITLGEVVVHARKTGLHDHEPPSSPSDPIIDTLKKEASAAADEIIALAEIATPYRPLGTIYMILCLAAAYVGAAVADSAATATAKATTATPPAATAADPTQRERVLHQLKEYQGDMRGRDAPFSEEGIRWVTRRFTLRA